MIKVGVTGGIGSGKTTFCKELETLGAYVVYADDLAKELMTSDADLVNAIKETFGDKAYFENGNLNRVYLAQEAFEKNRVQELNELVHPVLWDKVDELISEEEQKGTEVFVKEAAILLNNGRPKDLDFVVIIHTPESDRIHRVITRDQTEENKIKERMEKQPDFSSLKKLADYNIANNDSLDELKSEALKFYNSIRKN